MIRLAPLLLLALVLPAALRAEPVRIYAAASLTEVMGAVADGYAATGQPRPVLVLAGTPALARQILAGAPASVFIAADDAWMDAVASRIIPASRRAIAGNRLVLVVPASAPRRARLVPGFDLAGFVGAGRWTTGDPASLPVGRYARAALISIGAWDKAAPKLARADNVRAALAYVERGDAAAGVVYASDARASQRVFVAGTFPAASHPTITYPAALVAGHADAPARRFYAFLTGPQGRAILLQQGFGPP
ncbi:MAG: molybdate ABC transporter substrate-binding protein [Polymorphobacter sp.]